MIFQKIIILFIFLLLFIAPTQKELLHSDKDKSTLHASDECDVHSLNLSIKKSGWTPEIFKAYAHYITNHQINFSAEEKQIDSLPKGIERTFVKALLLKRRGLYSQMFDSLKAHLDNYPPFIEYYDELIFAANASGKLELLHEDKLKTEKAALGKELLNIFYNAAKGNYEDSRRAALSLIEEDSSNYLLYHHLAIFERSLGDYQQAFNHIEKAIRISGSDSLYHAKALLAQGALLYLSNKKEQAEKYYLKAFELSEKRHDYISKAKALVNIGILKDETGNIDSARDHFGAAIKIGIQLNELEVTAIAYSELGVSYSFTNHLLEAEENYLHSYEIFEQINNRSRLAYLANNLGRIFLNLANYRKAEEYFQKGLQFSGENIRGKIQNITGLADVYTNLSNYAMALKYYNEAKSLAEQIKEVSLSTEINLGIGSLNFNLNSYENALNYFKRAGDLNKETDNPYLQADISNKLGLVYLQLNNLDEAEHYLMQSIKTAEVSGDVYMHALSQLDLASVFIKRNNLEGAKEAIDISQRLTRANGIELLIPDQYLLLGEIYSRKKLFKDAKLGFEKALASAGAINNGELQIEACYRLAELYRLYRFPELAEAFYKKSIDLIEDISRHLFKEEETQIAYLTQRNEIYNSFASFYLSMEKYEEAFEIIDHSRSRSTIQSLANLKLLSLIKDEALLDKLYSYEWMINSGLYSKKEVDSISAVFETAKNELANKFPELSKYFFTSHHLSISEIQEKLDPKENILTVFTTGSSVHLFLINKKDFKHSTVKIRTEEMIEQLHKISPYFGNTISSESYYNQDLFSFDAKAANDFYSLVFKDILDQVPRNEKIIISTTTELFFFPIEFLVRDYNESESAYEYQNKKFLALDYNISYTPSCALYLSQKQNNLMNNGKVLLLGNPQISGNTSNYSERRGLLGGLINLQRSSELSPLQYSEAEVKQINEIIRADKVLLEEAATETNFKLNSEQNKIIHLSTHSFLVNKQPLIFFSNGEDSLSDGFLEIGEIVQLKLNSELVVLSSCNSGLGAVSESEGILGMTKAFYEAGAGSVIVSLWEVNDKYTSELMSLFYKKLREGWGKSEALRRAKVDFIKSHSSNPYYWAAFVISGNVDKVKLSAAVNIYPIATIILILMALSILFNSARIKHL